MVSLGHTSASENANSLLLKCCYHVEVGMTSDDILKLINQYEKDFGVEKHWHRPQVRIAYDTMLAFGKSSGIETTLSEDEIYFIDLGVSIDGFETDQAVTIAMNQTYQKLANASKEIWDRLYQIWQSSVIKPTGVDLYKKANDLAYTYGYQIDLSEGGHKINQERIDRVAPNELKYFNSPIEENKWILEIKLIDGKPKEGFSMKKLLHKR